MIGFHGIGNSYMFEDEEIGSYRPEIEEAEHARSGREAVSLKGRIVTNLMGHITNDLSIGKKIKSGELRKRLREPAWKVPDCFVTEEIQ